MKIVVIGAHLDDNVLSLGQMMAGVARSTSVTVFAGIPYSGLSDYDRASGFTSSSDAMHTRRLEDIAACELVGADPVHLDFFDRQYRRPADDHEITNALRPYFVPGTYTFVPLGIGHPDHEQVARCARVACANGEGCFFVEDLPYRVLHPEQAFEALEKVRTEGFELAGVPYPIEVGSRDVKTAAISAYASQYPFGPDPSCLVPERAWQARKLHPVERCDST